MYQKVECFECKKRTNNNNPKENQPHNFPFRCGPNGLRKRANDSCPFGEKGDPIVEYVRKEVFEKIN